MDKIRKCAALAKSIFYPTNVYGSQFPLIFGLSCCGLIPYKVVKQSLEPSKFCYFMSVVNVSFFAYSYIMTISKKTSYIECFFKTNISKVGNNIHFVVSFVCMIALYSSCIIQRKHLKAVFDQLHNIDIKLRRLSFESNHQHGFRYCCIALVVLWTTYFTYAFVIIYIVLLSEKGFFLHSWISYFLSNFTLNLVVFMFVCVLKQIKGRYQGCNEILSKLCGSGNVNNFNSKSFTVHPIESFQEAQFSSSNLLSKRKLVEVVKEICSIHDDLCDTCRIAEDYFALKMLTIVGIGFLIIVFNLYYVLEIAFGVVSEKFQDEAFKLLVFLIFQVKMNLLAIFCIIQSSCAITDENEKCSINVHKIMNTTNDEIVMERLSQFSLQLLNRKVQFTALRLFPLDRALIFTIAGAATTYLIILFQFSNQNNCTLADNSGTTSSF